LNPNNRHSGYSPFPFPQLLLSGGFSSTTPDPPDMLPCGCGRIIDHPQFAGSGHPVRITASIAIYPGFDPGNYQTAGDDSPGCCHIPYHPFNIHFNISGIMRNCIHLLVTLMISVSGIAQVGISTDGLPPDGSSMLDVRSTTKGMLVPRMTAAQRNAISSPATGLLIFCTDNNQYYSNKGTPAAPVWMMISSQWISSGSNLYYSDGNVGIGTEIPMQKLHVNGKILAEWGSITTASYRFGDGLENTGFSSPAANAVTFINNGVQSGRFDALGRMIIGTGSPVASAQLEVSSTTRGFLPPRMTTAQMNLITSPQAGLIVFNTTINALFWYSGSAWKMMTMTNDGESCGTVSYGGEIYTTVVIGTQCWMNENLNIGIAIIGANNQTDNGITEKYCYDNDPDNCLMFGGLYQWDEMMQYVTTSGTKGICPVGWHIPTDAEWDTLRAYLGGISVAGGAMKETGTYHWSEPNTGATNSSGFTSLPAGYRVGSSFNQLTITAGFWSSDAYSSAAAYSWHHYFNTASMSKDYDTKSTGFSCRCIKN
jgi:uncharacterized protein (TIGR02145 family)